MIKFQQNESMMMNIRNIFNRSNLTDQEVKTLRGVITALLRWPSNEYNEEKIKNIKKIADGNSNKHNKEH